MTTAAVYLIGAGPGDPSLISVKGLRLLQRADVVVHDQRVPAGLLRSVRPDAERIDVGASAPRRLEQDAINLLIADKAREGKTVARLKWGDPFVFNSGAKEALFLHEQGIPFEVVPGVPVALGGASYAGVPLTSPGAGDALVFIRGHEAETNAPPSVDWAWLAEAGGTIVSYAGGAQLDAVIDALLSHGRDPDEPAALVLRGTLPSQRTIHGTLREMQAVVRNAQRRGSGVLVVGSVVAMRDRLRWFDAKPLFGKRVLVTRPQGQAIELVERLLDLGADPIEAPTIRITDADDYGPLDEACCAIETFDWIIFTSANGVDHFLQRLLAGPSDVRALHGVKLCAIGPATAGRLTRVGLKVDLVPQEHRAEAIVTALQELDALAGTRILLPRADIARKELPRQLAQAGAEAVDVTAYRTKAVDRESDAAQDIYRMLLDQEIDIVTFTSASTVQNFVKMLGAEPAADLLRTTIVASIGPVTADAARALGIDTCVMPATYTVPALVDAIVDYVRTHADTEG